jgi:hypothetical protein
MRSRSCSHQSDVNAIPYSFSFSGLTLCLTLGGSTHLCMSPNSKHAVELKVLNQISFIGTVEQIHPSRGSLHELFYQPHLLPYLYLTIIIGFLVLQRTPYIYLQQCVESILIWKARHGLVIFVVH